MTQIKTKKNGTLMVHRDWDCEGAIRMENAKTIKRYHELRDTHPHSEKYGIFWAFSTEQYNEGKRKMKELGLYQDGQKVIYFGGGGYGTSEKGIEDFFNFYADIEKQIAKECDPQEVYFEEWNNHECMITGNDEEAFKVVCDIFGKDVAKTITRTNDCYIE